MEPDPLQIRRAVDGDIPGLRRLIDRAVTLSQRAFLDAGQIAASRAIMGLDTQLVRDGT